MTLSAAFDYPLRGLLFHGLVFLLRFWNLVVAIGDVFL
jgi:hypothetical protein